MLIAGDIGGTKTQLGIFSSEAGPQRPLTQAKFHSSDYPSLQVIVREFLVGVTKPIDRACFAAAGPVIDGHVKTTNLPWLLDETILAEALHLNPKSVHLLNDLEATARAVPVLRPNDVQTINIGVPISGGAIGVIAPGTGLGEAFLTWDEAHYLAHSSEGGHADFAPTNRREIGLLEYMQKELDHVSVEHVCSGIGIPHIYGYLRDVERIPEKPEVAALIAAAADPSALIIHHALASENPSKLCESTIDMFVSILASEAGNLAVKVLATGGIYMAGGVVTHMLASLQKPAFMQSFKRKGRLSELMAQIPIHVIVSLPALTGAAAYGLGNLKES
ncbi:MAG: glucokinase [Acidobacteriota bacterium]|nr:glucokinase [Acidobacteriota bacterium]